MKRSKIVCIAAVLPAYSTTDLTDTGPEVLSIYGSEAGVSGAEQLLITVDAISDLVTGE